MTDRQTDGRRDGQTKCEIGCKLILIIVSRTGRPISIESTAPTQLIDATIMRSCLSIMRSFSVTSANIAINDISLKPDSLDYIIVAEDVDLSSSL